MASWPVTTSDQSFTYNSPEPVGTLKVRHTDGDWPSALVVDYVEVGGVRYQTEDPSVHSVGSWDSVNSCGAGNKQSEWLSCGINYFEYAIQAATPASGQFTVIDSPEGYTTLGVRSEPVRTSPNEANVVAWLNTGDSVTRNSTQGDWSNITTTQGTTGWVENYRISTNSGGGGSTPTTGEFRVNVSPEGYTTLGLRSEPVRTSPNEANVVAWLNTGDTVNRIETQGEWSKVAAPNGAQGWAETARLDPTGNTGGNGGGGSDSGSGSEIPPLNNDGTPIVIFDTDMGPDIDDALALAMVHEYANRGMAQLAAVTLSRNSDTGARYNDAVNTFYCRPNIPIGVYRGSTSKDRSEEGFTADMIGRYPYNLNMSTVQEGHLVMRDVMRAAPDNSVVIIQVGFSTNTARLLEEYPDLVARKARLLSVMAGENNTGKAEFNISNARSAAQKVFNDWPTTLIQSEFRLGYDIHYPLSSINDDFNYQSNHIIKDSYMAPNYPQEMEWHPPQGSHYDMRSWDLTSVIAAIEDPSDYFSPLRRGRVSVDSSRGTTSFSEGGGDHYVLGLAREMSDAQQRRIVDRMTELTSARPHCGGDSGGGGTDAPPAPPPNGCTRDGSFPVILDRVASAPAFLYAEPNEPFSDSLCRAARVGSVETGQPLDIVESTTGYFRIRGGGWIRQSLTELPPPTPEPQPPDEEPPPEPRPDPPQPPPGTPVRIGVSAGDSNVVRWSYSDRGLIDDCEQINVRLELRLENVDSRNPNNPSDPQRGLEVAAIRIYNGTPSPVSVTHIASNAWAGGVSAPPAEPYRWSPWFEFNVDFWLGWDESQVQIRVEHDNGYYCPVATVASFYLRPPPGDYPDDILT